MSQAYDIKTSGHDTHCLICGKLIRAGDAYLEDVDGDVFCTEEIEELEMFYSTEDKN